MSGVSQQPFTTDSAPTPRGRRTYAPRSRPSCAPMPAMSILPAVCTASTCRATPASRVIAAILINRLNGAGFVVGVHHRHQGGVRAYRGGDVTGIHVAGRRWVDERDLDAQFSKRAGILEDRRVLDRGGNKMPGEPRAANVPHSAIALDSLPPEVSTTSSASTPNNDATEPPADSASAAASPALCALEGFPISPWPASTAAAACRVQRCGGRVVEIHAVRHRNSARRH